MRRQGEELEGPPGQAGAAVFENQGCGSCHTFEPAKTTARTGPDLDNLAASAREAGQPLERYVRQSIVAPDAYIHPGFPPNVMPKTYERLPDGQLDSLVQYLVEANQ